MSTYEILTAIQSSAIGQAIAKSDHLVGATAQIFHVLGFIFLLSSLVLINLRLLGVTLTNLSIPEVAKEPLRFIWAGLFFAVSSGILMFVSAPLLYWTNPAFDLKIVLLVAAVLLQVTAYRKVISSETPNPALARASVAASVVLWFGVGLAGRAIGYV